eukprot:60136_1
MKQIRNRVISQHTHLLEQLEMNYLNYIQQLLIQKSKITEKMQRDFYKQLHTLDRLSTETQIYVVPDTNESLSHVNVHLAWNKQTRATIPQHIPQSVECSTEQQNTKSNKIKWIDVVKSSQTTFTSNSHHVRKKVQNSSSNSFKCPYPKCNKACTTRFGLKCHFRSHTGEKPFKCDYTGCNKTFP